MFDNAVRILKPLTSDRTVPSQDKSLASSLMNLLSMGMFLDTISHFKCMPY